MLEKLDNNKKLTFICAGVFLCVMIFVMTYGFDKKVVIKVDDQIDKERINNMFDNIKDNYTLTITENINNNYVEYIYYTDGNLELYESNQSDYGYVVYNDNIFYLDDTSMNLYKTKQDISFINNEYYDYEFIKVIIKHCDYKYVSSNVVSCSLSLNDYFNSYNSFYNTNYHYGDESIEIKIKYSDNINSLDIDYTNVNKAINNSYDIVNYKLMFSNFNKNNFDEIFDYYRDVLES